MHSIFSYWSYFQRCWGQQLSDFKNRVLILMIVKADYQLWLSIDCDHIVTITSTIMMKYWLLIDTSVQISPENTHL